VSSKFYTARGLLTVYALRCGYIERKGKMSLDMRHGVYHVVGFLHGNTHATWGSFGTLREARQFMNHPDTHIPSHDGSVGGRPTA
jgi:hypothetical protein